MSRINQKMYEAKLQEIHNKYRGRIDELEAQSNVANYQAAVSLANSYKAQVEQLEDNAIADTENIKALIVKGTGLQAKLDAVRGLRRYEAVNFDLNTKKVRMNPSVDGEVVRYVDVQAALKGEDDG